MTKKYYIIIAIAIATIFGAIYIYTQNTRYDIQTSSKGIAYKIDRKTGETTVISGQNEYSVGNKEKKYESEDSRLVKKLIGKWKYYIEDDNSNQKSLTTYTSGYYIDETTHYIKEKCYFNNDKKLIVYAGDTLYLKESGEWWIKNGYLHHRRTSSSNPKRRPINESNKQKIISIEKNTFIGKFESGEIFEQIRIKEKRDVSLEDKALRMVKRANVDVLYSDDDRALTVEMELNNLIKSGTMDIKEGGWRVRQVNETACVVSFCYKIWKEGFFVCVWHVVPKDGIMQPIVNLNMILNYEFETSNQESEKTKSSYYLAGEELFEYKVFLLKEGMTKEEVQDALFLNLVIPESN